jgi:hypothetical protein
MCGPAYKGHAYLTSSSPSYSLSLSVFIKYSALPVSNYERGLRSLRDLTQHLTTRADDGHAAPVLTQLNEELLPIRLLACQRLVRFFVYHRIKPHVPPLVRVSVNSFKFHALRHYDSGGQFNALAVTLDNVQRLTVIV